MNKTDQTDIFAHKRILLKIDTTKYNLWKAKKGSFLSPLGNLWIIY